VIASDHQDGIAAVIPDIDPANMKAALRLAHRSLGNTWPNPAVGAVIVDDEGVIIARGRTRPGGRPHAERSALDAAGDAARGAQLYVTLEPCAHQGGTPPCADAIIAAGIERVVVACRDPDSRVAGRGVARLREAGIAVTEGVCREAARWLNAGHTLSRTKGRPFVQLKLAVSGDGRIAAGSGRPVWVTGGVARARAHLMRARADAILIGRGTALADNPELTCRIPGLAERSPMRVVLDSGLAIAPTSRLLAGAEEVPLWLFCASDTPRERDGPLLEQGALIQRVDRAEGGGLDLQAILRELAERGITRVLVEGGPHVARSFLDAGLVDEVVVFRGTGTLGCKALEPFVTGGLERLTDCPDWQCNDQRRLDTDTLTVYRNRATERRIEAAEKAITEDG